MTSDTLVKSVIVYDGACAFCRRAIEAIRQRDRNDQFIYFVRQTPGLDEKYPELAIGNFDTGMRLIEPNGTIRIGADAIYVIASKLPYFRCLAWTYQLPLVNGVTQRIYSWVAANRLKLSRHCGDSCEVTADSQLPSKRNTMVHVPRYRIAISVIILLILGLHLWADAAKALRSSWMGDKSWPFLAYGMYRQSYKPGIIRATKQHIIAITARKKEIELNRSTVGMGGQALYQHFIDEMIGGNPIAAARLADRINLDRTDPVIAFRMQSESYAITDDGVITEGKRSMVYPVTE
jgi:predicted DCC family thiol-disulfide oxidoreductase YuxK